MNNPELQAAAREIVHHLGERLAHDFADDFSDMHDEDYVLSAANAIVALVEQGQLEEYDAGYLDGFKASGEGFNGEYPFGDRGASDDEIWTAINPRPKEQPDGK